jgi:hypothetical protein
LVRVEERKLRDTAELVCFADRGVESMRTTEQISSFWEQAREPSADGEVLRRRIAAIGAFGVAMCGFLLAVGLGVVVLILFAGIVVFISGARLPALWPRLRTSGANGIAFVRDRSSATWRWLGPRRERLQAGTRTGLAKTRARGNGVVRAAAVSGSRARHAVGRTARSTAIRFVPQPGRLDARREAIRLNAVGTQHRRSGRCDEAVECHRQALDILRLLGDRRGVAMTQSNLALALSRGGDHDWSVALLEEAAATLRELGDTEHEAQIMANLGLIHRRHGRRKEGDNVLQLALSKLNPASNVYQAIEAELRRAS